MDLDNISNGWCIREEKERAQNKLRARRQVWLKPSTAVPFTPKRSSNLDNSNEWSTVSKAADESNKRSIADSLLSIAHRMSFWTLTKAVSVEWEFLYADWNVLSKWCFMTWSVSCVATTFSTSLDTTFKFEIGRRFWNYSKSASDFSNVGDSITLLFDKAANHAWHCAWYDNTTLYALNMNVYVHK